jgi:membrane fusion protein (multidrug efflux system)
VRAPFPSGVRVLLILALIAGAASVSFLGCSRDGRAEDSSDNSEAVANGDEGGDSEASEESEEDQPVPVEVVTLMRGPLESIVRSTASVEAENQVGVFAEAARRVRKIHVEEGDTVRRGQLLLQLQSAEQVGRLDRARASFEQATREHERQKRLFTENLTSEKAATDAEYELERAQLELNDAQREFGYTEVRAPIAGMITERYVRVGDQVQLSAHLFDIVDFESLVTLIYVPERELKHLQVGQRARLRADALSDEVYDGHVLRIAPIVDARSGTIKVTVAVDGSTPLRPGVYTDVEVVTAVREAALRLPKRALVYDGDQMFAYKLGDDEVATRMLVVPGLSSPEFVEPSMHFEEGDRIIVAGQAGLKDGAKVEVVDPDVMAEAAADAPDAP